jgi:hypothetical protein
LVQQEADEAAPMVSKTLIDKGCKLYALQRERRDLETVFGEISNAKLAGGSSHG